MTTSSSTELAAARVRAALLRLALVEAKAGYRSDQPRTPAGNHELSGRWNGGAGSGGGASGGGGSGGRGSSGGDPQARAAKPEAVQPAPLAPKQPDMITATRQKVVGAVNDAADKVVEAAHALEGQAENAMAEAWDHVPEPIRTAVDDAIAKAAPPVADFLVANRDAVARTLGGLQAAGGLVQVAGGGSIAVGGVTSGPGELAAGALGTWMVGHGIDDFRVGVTTLITGEPTPSALFLGFKALGLNDNAAAISDAGLSTLTPGVLAKMSEGQLAKLAEPGLLRDSIETLLDRGVKVAPTGSFWADPSIVRRGLDWEKFDARQLHLPLLPAGFPTIDIWDKANGVIISNKTLDFRASRYANEPFSRLGARLNGMVDSVAKFQGAKRLDVNIPLSEIRERRLHLAIPAGRIEPGQAVLLRGMQARAKRLGVVVRITRVR